MWGPEQPGVDGEGKNREKREDSWQRDLDGARSQVDTPCYHVGPGFEGNKVKLWDLKDGKAMSLDPIFVEIDQKLGKPILKHNVFISAHFD